MRTVFALSGNHIMSVFDALYNSGIEIIHARHEAACVQMADAYARVTGTVGVALVTGGQGFTNAVASMPTAIAADSPVLLLSGDTSTTEAGRGAFQELSQVAISAPLTKVSVRAVSADDLGNGVARVISTVLSGRPGPAHIALPTDLLERSSDAAITVRAKRIELPTNNEELRDVASLLSRARRPILIAGPMFAHANAKSALHIFEQRTRIPAVLMESPRGLNDPSLGAFADALAEADVVVLAGKPLDFTLRFGAPPAVAQTAKFVVLDFIAAVAEAARRERPTQVAASAVIDADRAVSALSGMLGDKADAGWFETVSNARQFRPAEWARATGTSGRLHPIAICHAVQAVLDRDARSVFISDGGEIGQWAQAGITAPRRVINGVGGSIGSAIPFALGARCAERKSAIVAVMGDGTFGFHMSEFDTAVRHDLPFVAIIGNDARWNAEYQIQLRDFGAERSHGCSLLPTRYDQVVAALGGHGEIVTHVSELAPALDRALASGKPACINVMIDGLPAPNLVAARAKLAATVTT